MKRLLVAFALVAGLATGTAFADDRAIAAAQKSIESQLLAFRADDPSTAYGFAAPSIRRMFPTQDIFMSMVRQGYRPVHRSTGFSFGPAQIDLAGRVMQKVTITGSDGKLYDALYTLDRQEDGSYLISGVSLRASTALST